MRFNLLLLFVFIITANASYAQPPAKTTLTLMQLEQEFNAQGVRVYSINGKMFTGTTKDVSKEYGFVRQCTFVDGLKQKEMGWYANGNLERNFEYKDGKPHGKLIIYHLDGTTKFIEENYINGVQEGTQRGWNSDGTLRFEEEKVGGTTLLRFDYEKTGKDPIPDRC